MLGGGERLRFTDAQRRRLALKARSLSHAKLRDLGSLVTPTLSPLGSRGDWNLQEIGAPELLPREFAVTAEIQATSNTERL